MRLVRGAAGSGRTALVFKEFRQAIQSGRTDVRIVVPTATLVEHYQHELARQGVVFAPGLILSLSRFAQERAELQPVPDTLVRAIVRDTLRRLDLPEFSRVAMTEGMATETASALAMLEEAGASIKDLHPDRPLARIWRAVDAGVRDRGLVSKAEVFRAAAANQHPLKIWMDGFLHFNALELELLRSLQDVTLTWDDTSEFPGFNVTEERLTGQARQPRTVVVEAPTIEREAEDIARRILELQGAGTPPGEIGIAIRDQNTWLPLLRVVLERYGIPARFYFVNSLHHHPLLAFTGDVIEAILSDWDFEIALPALRANPAWDARADFDRFDFKVREAMPGRGPERLLALCENSALRVELAACAEHAPWRDERAKPAVWQQRLLDLGLLYRLPMQDAPLAFADIQTARSHTAAQRAWGEAIDTATAFWKDEDARVSLAEFWQVAAGIANDTPVRIPDHRSHVVPVLSAQEARQWDFQHLFICGMTNRDYPRAVADNLMLAGIDVAIPSRDEEQLFASLIHRASDTLHLSVSKRDAAGRSIPPSRFLTGNQEPSQLSMPAPAHTAPAAIHAGNIDASLLSELAALHKSVSLSRLEDLMQCRFRFFAAQTLKLAPQPERPGERLQPRITGSMMHSALENWLAGNRQGDFVECFEAAFEEGCSRYHLPPGYRLEVERITSHEIARKASANVAWHADSSLTEVDLMLDFPGGIVVKGRVDRIDRFGETDCVVLDYKAGKTTNVRKMLSSTTKLQGPLYALAIREQLQWNPKAVIFWAVREDLPLGWGEVPGVKLDLQPFPDGWMEAAKAGTIERLDGFLSGNIDVQPTDADLCRWCDFQGACRYVKTELVQLEVPSGA